ncbi:hypothetical protein TEA_027348 [Camellia sinensis var. sinensis]|uniref:Alpha-1,4 glucan phosphorylase n=1 Tax=Camellia sinensis var. sinensis TaxID=542762 RepID=A0A4S4EGN7_CAMSN|nr:hypothetical protein TEA_027348 [Camellia sinensis var. sinensis]
MGVRENDVEMDNGDIWVREKYSNTGALSHSVRDRLIERWHDTQQYFKKKDPKRLYFLSLEFLMGRSLSNSVINLGVRAQYAAALSQLGFEFEVLAEQEGDAALGNGGLARLSACQMDSLATLDYPAMGYGLRYQYGLFRQIILDGFQHEQPDYWLNFGNPWEIERVHVSYTVKVEAVAYDNPIPGYGTRNTINLRLWAAKPSNQYDLESFNTGDYINSVVNTQKAEAISNILYPDDRSYQGKELRLKQQYFFVSASLQDIIRRFKDGHDNFDDFLGKVALQLNDTHPSLAIPEVMRVLVDEEHLGWNRAWDIVCKLFSFTTHTVLPEALEKIPVLTGINVGTVYRVLSDPLKSRTLKRCAQFFKRRAQSIKRCAIKRRAHVVVERRAAHDARVCLG